MSASIPRLSLNRNETRVDQRADANIFERTPTPSMYNIDFSFLTKDTVVHVWVEFSILKDFDIFCRHLSQGDCGLV